MEEGDVRARCAERAVERQACVGQCQFHPHGQVGHLAVQVVDAAAVEGDRASRLQALVQEEGSRGPLPALRGGAFEGQFFADRVQALALCQAEHVVREEVLVHEEAVGQVLVGRDRRQGERFLLPFGAQPRAEQAAAVAALPVLRDEAQEVCMFLLAGHRTFVDVGTGILVAVFIVHLEVNLQRRGGSGHRPQPSACRVAAVGMPSCRHVAEETLLPVIESPDRKGHVLRRVDVGGERGAPGVGFRGETEAHVGAVAAEGVAGVDPDESAHRVAPVEGALRATEHVEAFHVEEVEIVGAFVGVGHVVHVKADSRRVDARADAPDVDGRRDARAVVRHEEVGHEGRCAFYVGDAPAAECFAAQQG